MDPVYFNLKFCQCFRVLVTKLQFVKLNINLVETQQSSWTQFHWEMADICWKGKLEMTLLPFVWLSSSASLAELFHHPVACVTQHDLRAISVQKFKAPYLSNWISQSWSSGFWVWTANLAKIWIFTHLAAFLLHLNLQSSIVLLDKLDIL